MSLAPLDRMWDRGRLSSAQRVARLRDKLWQIGQCAVAAGVAWWVARDLLGHPTPFFAPIAAVVSLGTSYGQRLHRVIEVSLGVAIGIFLADVLQLWVGSGPLTLTVVVAVAMSLGFLLNPGPLFVTQIAVQAIVVVAVASPTYAFTRWTDALVGGAVALVAATVVPRAPLRRPREQAARVVRRLAKLLRAAASSARTGNIEEALSVLSDARATDSLIAELRGAADEGLSVLASSPFRRRHTGQVRRMVELVEPLDRAMGNTRVLVRRIAVTNYHHQPVPESHADLCDRLARAADEIAEELAVRQMATKAREALIAVGAATGRVDSGTSPAAMVVVAQLRSIVVDLLQVTGLDANEATDALPRPPA